MLCIQAAMGAMSQMWLLSTRNVARVTEYLILFHFNQLKFEVKELHVASWLLY